MRLKSIEMQGFKSFPDRTVMEFSDGITCIIGPNGSGKSNISDAVRWVLGEMRMKSLRGTRMEDIIFNGAGDRPQANCASVSLVLDTEEEYLESRRGLDTILTGEEPPADPETVTRVGDCREITVMRKYYRSGESEYYINKRQVRLRDVYDLFYDTGIGREGYSVIGQGKIAEILSQRADERRSVFEEAAGISRFRVRREEAERRLGEVKINLDRANDVLSEITTQLEPLRKQSEDAREYLVLGEERRGIEITLWLERLEILRQRRTECGELLSAARMALDSAEERAAGLEHTLDSLLEKAQNDSRLAGEAEQRKSAAERRRADFASLSAVCEREHLHLTESAQSLLAAADAAQDEINNAEGILSTATAELEKLAEKLAEAEERSTAAREAYAARAAETAGLEASEGSCNAAYTAAIEEQGRLMSATAAIDAELESIKRTEQENDGRITASEQRCEELGAELKTAESEEKACREALSKLLSGVDECRVKAEAQRVQLNEHKKLETDERLRLTAAEQRREHLRQLEKLLVGYSDGVKAVMNGVQAGKIKKNGTPVSVRGLVSNLFSANGKYVQALETALASSVQFIVVDDEEDARACISYLKSTSGGKATFLPLTSVRGRRSDVSAIRDMDGFVGVASELAEYAPEYEGVAAELLGRTAVAENLEKASVMARKLGYSLRFVTLDGQMINAGGSYTGGSGSSKTGLFTRAHDLEELGTEIRGRNATLIEYNRQIELIESEIVECEAQSARLSESAVTARNSLDAASAVLSGCRARVDEEKNHLASLKEFRQSGKSGIAEAIARKTALEQRGLEARTRLEDKKHNLESLAESLSKARAAEQTAFEESDAAVNRFFECRSIYESQANAVKAQKERIAGAERRRANSLADRKIALENAQTKLAEANALAEKAAEAEKEANAAGEEMSGLLRSRTEIEGETSKVRAALKIAQGAKEEAFRENAKREGECARIDEENEQIAAKMWDSYELTYSAAQQYRLPEEKMKGAQARLAQLVKRIKSMGSINLNAVEQYAEVSARHEFLTAQIEDLNKSRRSLDSTIAKLDANMKETFTETIARINVAFDEVFRELFGGGGAYVELADPENPLECGIDITLKIPGKRVRSITLLSGGEQSFSAIALYLALQKINPAPFCIFDEIESALDDVNIVKLADYVRSCSEKTQYIMITHRRGTMERADTLYGVTMPKKGVSAYIKLDLAGMDEHIKRYV